MDSLQFDKAEFADPRPKCAACRTLIDKSYFHLSGHTVCPECASKVRARQGRPPHAAVVRGLLFGAGAAIVCSIVYAIVTWVTNAEFALLSIGVGYVIGRAVRMGSSGLGGRRCQIAAVLLTYFAITTSYVPMLIKGARDQTAAHARKTGAANPEVESVNRGPAMGMATAAVLIVGIAAASPFLGITQGVSGLLGLFIIFMGLLQAWRLTARDSRPLLGPYWLNDTPEGGQAVA